MLRASRQAVSRGWGLQAGARRLLAASSAKEDVVKPESGSDGIQKGTEEQEQAAGDKTLVPVPEPPQPTAAAPSYIGYLSGVITHLWPYSATESAAKAETPAKPVQRPPVKRLNRSESSAKTETIVRRFLAAESSGTQLLKLQELSNLILDYPYCRSAAISIPPLIPRLLSLVDRAHDLSVRDEARQCLSLLGYADPIKGRGLRILSIDGGGTRGILGLEVLDALEKAAGNKKIYELFDVIVGVSTGAIIASLIGVKRKSIDECKAIYLEISKQLFTQTKIYGVSGLLLNHSYYNSKKYVEVLQHFMGDSLSVIHTAREKRTPKLAIVSSIVNAPQLQPYVFRNYEHPAGRDSHFRGGAKHMLYEAVQCSSAAPGYFEEVPLGTVVHQDGGVLANNPTAIGIHEARSLWPEEPLQCVVSIGNGRSVAELDLTATRTATRIQDKFSRIVDSATDTELVHLALTDLLSSGVYFRLNPYMSFPYSLDEVDPEKLVQMRRDSQLYIRRNRRKIAFAAQRLTETPTLSQSIRRWLFRLKARHGFYDI